MSRYHKVIWSEGLFIVQHHFQQWDRYHENLVHVGMKSLSPYYWGLTALQINEAAIENGTFMLESCKMVLRNGLIVDIPEDLPKTGGQPMERAVEPHFPQSGKLDVYLAIPIERPGAANYSISGNGDLSEKPYILESATDIVDTNTGETPFDLPIAKKNLKIRFTGETLDGHHSIKIAELERTTTGDIALSRDYIPPCLSIAASDRFKEMLRHLIDVLLAKSREFRTQRQGRTGEADFSALDMFNLSHLQMLNGFITQLNHFYHSGEGHPETVFRVLSSLAGMLTSFSPDTAPTDLPEYRHEDLRHAFSTLERVIHQLLLMLTPMAPPAIEEAPPPPAKYKVFQLSEVRDTMYEASIPDEALDGMHTLYLAVGGRADLQELKEMFQRQAKIASPNEIGFLIGKALPGVGRDSSPTAPSVVSLNPQDFINEMGHPHDAYGYFKLVTFGDFWDDVQNSKVLAVYVPPDFGKIELGFIAAEEGE